LGESRRLGALPNLGRSNFSETAPSQPRAPRAEARQPGPVGVALALGNSLEEMIPDQTRDRHWHHPGVAHRERKAYVPQAERHFETIGRDFSSAMIGP
jgi:hypothetical protein